ncbi:MAG: twitching motility protein PilT, partial [Bacillati bacterium ANGP1]
MDVTDLLVKTRDMGASDLHLTVASPPTMRVNGKLTRLKSAALTRDEIHAMLYDLLSDEQKAQYEATHDLDFSLELGNVGRFRINAFLGRLGPGVVLRLIASKIKSLDELGFPPILKDLSVQEQGLVL